MEPCVSHIPISIKDKLKQYLEGDHDANWAMLADKLKIPGSKIRWIESLPCQDGHTFYLFDNVLRNVTVADVLHALQSIGNDIAHSILVEAYPAIKEQYAKSRVNVSRFPMPLFKCQPTGRMPNSNITEACLDPHPRPAASVPSAIMLTCTKDGLAVCLEMMCQLQRDGFDATMFSDDNPLSIQHSFNMAKLILVLVSPGYVCDVHTANSADNFSQRPSRTRKVARYVFQMMMTELFDANFSRRRFFPVLSRTARSNMIPMPLADTVVHRYPSGYEALKNFLLRQAVRCAGQETSELAVNK